MSVHQNGQLNGGNKNTPAGTPSTAAERKFQKAQERLQESIKKHMQNYESSSSEEEEVESENVIRSILKKYNETGGNTQHLGRTQAFLQEFLQNGDVCLICISGIKRNDAIWSCIECYNPFHLECIQRWAKDRVIYQKQANASENQNQLANQEVHWNCPKCRHDYSFNDIPTKYLCFCKKTENPTYEPFLVPHSCGEICKKDLKPLCGHKCLLLCHPGPCPPCPVTVKTTCFCGSSAPQAKRCSNKGWSCGNPCRKSLNCGKHSCNLACHPGKCPPCSKKSLQKCFCKARQQLRDCTEPEWQCDKMCMKMLECGIHSCLQLCHKEGECGPCLMSLPRTCPCGGSTFLLPCTEETPTCLDTCGKLLDCGQHTCYQRCHKDKCGTCLEIVKKQCRCGLHFKEIQCYKSFLCETKCKRMKDCGKHPCNRKCCDGNCPPCEKPCGRTLGCGNHKCPSVCHRGSCYPCNLTETASCRCGHSKLEFPCGLGRKKRIKPPKCDQLCKAPPDCHHEARENHKCHFGDCPPCKQICNKTLAKCGHKCPERCHSAVLVEIKGETPSMPWEKSEPQYVLKNLPCPPCKTLVRVNCLGLHEISELPCHRAKPYSCGRQCGRELPCKNHFCKLECHTVDEAGRNCEEMCGEPCNKQRPENCAHPCPNMCHADGCPPCKEVIRVMCHCSLNKLSIPCYKWSEADKEKLMSCGDRCPKMYECGHRCKADCHSGPCPNPDKCEKKVKIYCECKRLKREISCKLVRNGQGKINCDEVCKEKLEESRKIKKQLEEEKRKEELIKNAKELEKFNKMFEGRKKNKNRRIQQEEEEISFIRKYLLFILGIIAFVVAAISGYFLINT